MTITLDTAEGVAIAAELYVTRAAWPSLADSDALFTVYSEQLEPFTSDEIRAGFKLARQRADRFPPRPGDVRKGCAEVVQSRKPAPSHIGPDVFCPMCQTTDLYVADNGRFRPLHALTCSAVSGWELRELEQVRQSRVGIWWGGRSPAHTQPETRDWRGVLQSVAGALTPAPNQLPSQGPALPPDYALASRGERDSPA